MGDAGPSSPRSGPLASDLNRTDVHRTSLDASAEGANLLQHHEREGVSRDSSGSVSSDLELDHLRDRDTFDSAEGEMAYTNGKKWERAPNKRYDDPPPDGAAEDYLTESNKDALASRIFIRNVIVNVSLILAWYLFSVSISVYNKWMFAKDPNREDVVNFPFPLFTTSIHMLVQFILASLVLLAIPSLRPKRDFKDPHDPLIDRASLSATANDSKTKPIMTPRFYATRVAPCGIATGLDIGLGNTSLELVTLTFFTMVKSSTLGFVLGFAILFRLETASWKIGGIITVMTVGVIMMVAGETEFSTVGFILLMTASFFSGLRWSLVQILLRRNPATSNPFASLFFLTPVMFVVLAAIALPVESPSEIAAGFHALAEVKGTFLGILILLFPGVLAFCMTASEFALLQRTSVVTLSVCGIFKEVITISTAGIVFGDELTPINISGLFVTIAAIGGYNYLRIIKMRQEAKEAVPSRPTEEEAPMLSTEGQESGVIDEGGRQFNASSSSGQVMPTSIIPGVVHPSRDRRA